MGGISTDSGCVVFVLVQYGRVPFGGSVLERRGRGLRGLVFGTLLGPEATGPGRVTLFRDVCFWFPGCTDHTVVCAVGAGCVGCVVRGCCLRTT